MYRAYRFLILTCVVVGLINLDQRLVGQEQTTAQLEPTPEIARFGFEKCPVELAAYSAGVFYYVCDNCQVPGTPITAQSAYLHLTICFTDPFSGTSHCACPHVGNLLAVEPELAHYHRERKYAYQDEYITMDSTLNIPKRSRTLTWNSGVKICVTKTLNGPDGMPNTDDDQVFAFRVFEFVYLTEDNDGNQISTTLYIAQELDPKGNNSSTQDWELDSIDWDQRDFKNISLGLTNNGTDIGPVPASIKDR